MLNPATLPKREAPREAWQVVFNYAQSLNDKWCHFPERMSFPRPTQQSSMGHIVMRMWPCEMETIMLNGGTEGVIG